MAAYVKEYSDILVEELTLREELDREKEIKNNFISTLLAVQSKIRESQTGQGKGKKGSSAYSGKVSESWSKEQYYCLSQDAVTLDVDCDISFMCHWYAVLLSCDWMEFHACDWCKGQFT